MLLSGQQVNDATFLDSSMAADMLSSPFLALGSVFLLLGIMSSGHHQMGRQKCSMCRNVCHVRGVKNWNQSEYLTIKNGLKMIIQRNITWPLKLYFPRLFNDIGSTARLLSERETPIQHSITERV